MTQTRTPPAIAASWSLDPDIAHLNHGSFGATPNEVMDFQREIRGRIERQPVQFFARDWEPLLDEAKDSLGHFLGAQPSDLAFLHNATAGVNTVLRSLAFEPGDELLTTNHEYNACANALRYVADRSGATPVIVDVPFPIQSADEVYDAVMAKVTDRTRIALLDHVTSPTALIFPIERLVRDLQDRGVDVLVDGAHAPGMLPVDLDSLGAAYYTGNLHKWVCGPKGAAFLHVREDRQQDIVPLSISHGFNSPRTDRSRFEILFGWTGTTDPSAWLSIPTAIECMRAMRPGGWPEVMEHNRSLALQGRDAILNALGIDAPAPDDMIGCMASIPLPDNPSPSGDSALYADPIQDDLLERWRIEAPVPPWPESPKRLLRISAQLYNEIGQYEQLGEAVKTLLDEGR